MFRIWNNYNINSSCLKNDRFSFELIILIQFTKRFSPGNRQTPKYRIWTLFKQKILLAYSYFVYFLTYFLRHVYLYELNHQLKSLEQKKNKSFCSIIEINVCLPLAFNLSTRGKSKYSCDTPSRCVINISQSPQVALPRLYEPHVWINRPDRIDSAACRT